MSYVGQFSSDHSLATNYRQGPIPILASSLYVSPKELPSIPETPEASNAPIVASQATPFLVTSNYQTDFPAFACDAPSTTTAFKLNTALIQNDFLFRDGKAHFEGLGMKVDKERGRKLIQQAADLGHTGATRYLKHHDANEKAEKELKIKKEDLEKLTVSIQLEFYRKAAQYGNDEIINETRDKMFSEGKALYQGDRFKVNLPKARRLLKQAKALGHPKARHYLKQLLAVEKTEKVLMMKLENLQNVSFPERIRFYRKAVEYGNDDCLCILGRIYQNTNPQKAMNYFFKAMDQGNDEASKILNEFFWVMKSKADTDPEDDDHDVLEAENQYCLSLLYRSLLAGDNEDLKYKLEEYEYLEKAASEGHPLALRRLQLIPNPNPRINARPNKEIETTIDPTLPLAKDEEVVMLPPMDFSLFA